MRLIKIIQVTIDVRDPIALYAAEDGLLRALAAKYEGRCYRGVYVLAVRKIVRQGDCIINQDGDPSFGITSALVEVECIMLARGEILLCTVQSATAHFIAATAGAITTASANGGADQEVYNVFIAMTPLLKSITAGQHIPVRALDFRAPPGDRKIAVNGALYVPTHVVMCYRVDAVATANSASTQSVQSILAAIADEHAETATMQQSAAWKNFATMLTVYKTPPKLPGEQTSIIAIAEVVGNAPASASTRWLVIHPALQLPLVLVLDQEARPTAAQLQVGALAAGAPAIQYIENLTPAAAVSEILYEYYYRQRALREMTSMYTVDKIKPHSNLWQIYNKNKL